MDIRKIPRWCRGMHRPTLISGPVSFPDTESSKDPVEHVVGYHGADNLAQLIDGRSQVERDQLVPCSVPERLGRP